MFFLKKLLKLINVKLSVGYRNANKKQKQLIKFLHAVKVKVFN